MYKTLKEINSNYQLIEVKPNEYVLVDKEAEIKEGDYYSASDGWYIEKATKEDLEVLSEKRNGYAKIILASASLNLDGVDKMEEVDGVEELAKIALPEIKRSTGFGSKFMFEPKRERRAFIKGYNTHKQSTDKKYSEEQMLECFREGYNLCLSKHYEILDGKIHPDEMPFYYDYENPTDKSYKEKAMDGEEFIQSLNQKKLIFEVEDVILSNGKGHGNYTEYQFKKTNEVVKYTIL